MTESYAIDQIELACLIVENVSGVQRPRGCAAHEAINGLSSELRARAMDTALVVIDYVAETLGAVVTFEMEDGP